MLERHLSDLVQNLLLSGQPTVQHDSAEAEIVLCLGDIMLVAGPRRYQRFLGRLDSRTDDCAWNFLKTQE